MILYFSGTGNTRYVAQSLALELGSESKMILDVPPSELGKENLKDGLIFVCPVYSWGIPPLILQYIKQIPEHTINEIRKGDKPVWLVLTCGDETGMAPEMFLKAFNDRGITPRGIWSIQMPNNYVLLPGFNIDTPEVEQEKLTVAPTRIREIANAISKKEEGINVVRGSRPKLKTTVVYPLFKKWGMIPKKWGWTKECIMCGKCAKVCPERNIEMRGNHPRWHNNCVSCLACYHICPVHAVKYGSMTNSKGQYFCKLKPTVANHPQK